MRKGSFRASCVSGKTKCRLFGACQARSRAGKGQPDRLQEARVHVCPKTGKMPDITFREFEMPDVGTPSLDQLQVVPDRRRDGQLRRCRPSAETRHIRRQLHDRQSRAATRHRAVRSPAHAKAGAHRGRRSPVVKSPGSVGRDRRPAREREGPAQWSGGRGNPRRRRDVSDFAAGGRRAGIRSEHFPRLPCGCTSRLSAQSPSSCTRVSPASASPERCTRTCLGLNESTSAMSK